ncbi:MAG: phosphate/phosphite/phosphonate ABC transporter substrate-binding protein [Gemmatimonadota bacterium]
MRRAWIILGLCLLLLPGCADKGKAPAGPGTQGRTLVIGLIPERNIFKQLERYQPLANYLRARTGIEVRLKVLSRYGNIIDNFRSAGLDGAFFGSFTYALAHARLGLTVLARPEDAQGVSTYYGLIFVRKDSGIRTAKAMKGKRFAFVDKATTAGYLLPLEYFRNNRIRDYKAYFRETYFAGTHEDAVYDVLNRKADVGAAKNTVYERLAVADGRITRDLAILARSPEVPENGLAVRGDIEDPVKTALRDALVGMDRDPAGREVLEAFGARRFIATSDRDYQSVFDYARAVGIDLVRYDYRNE